MPISKKCEKRFVYFNKSLITSLAINKPALDGTKDVLPGITLLFVCSLDTCGFKGSSWNKQLLNVECLFSLILYASL